MRQREESQAVQMQHTDLRKLLKVKYKDCPGTCWWDGSVKKEVDYFYLEACSLVALRDYFETERKEICGEERFIVKRVRDQTASKKTVHKRHDEESSNKGCYNCLSTDHPPHRCLKNPVESSPLYMQTGECTHCEGKGHIKSMCKAEGGPCHGIPGVCSAGVSATVRAQPLVVMVAADATKENSILESAKGKNRQEIRLMRQACSKPKSEFENFQEKLHFSALRQSHDDFLILFGEKCERYKRNHHTTLYGAEVPEVGFTTPTEVRYRPLGEARRKIETRIRDLTKGLRYPPQTNKEQQDRKRKAERQQTKQQNPSQGEAGDKKSQRHRFYKHRYQNTKPETVASGKKTDEDMTPAVVTQLKKILDIAEKKNVTGQNGCLEAAEELQRRREKAKERRREEVREAIESRKQVKQEGNTKPVMQGKMQTMFLRRFSFPKEELLASQSRVDLLKKGETLISTLDENDSAEILFPEIFLKIDNMKDVKLLPEEDEVSMPLRPMSAPAPDHAPAPPLSPPSDPIANWRLKCIEDFNPSVKPPKRLHRSVSGGHDMEVDGFNCTYWSFRFLNKQFRSQIKLQNKLERRKNNRDKVYKSVDYLVSLAQRATEQAKGWSTPTGGKSPRQDLWSQIIREEHQQNYELNQRVTFYSKILYYCDLIGAPTTTLGCSFLTSLRQILLDGTGASRTLFNKLLNGLTPAHLSEAEVTKVLHYIRSDLCIDLSEVGRVDAMHNHGHTHGHRRNLSRTTLVLMNLPSHQMTSALYVAYRAYGGIVRIKRDDASTAVIAFYSDVDAAEMKRWEDQVQIDGLPLMVAFAEAYADDEIHAARELKPSEEEWKCWLCMRINSLEDETCTGQNCDVAKGIEKRHFDHALRIDVNAERPLGFVEHNKRTTVIATEIPKDTEKSTIQRVFSRYGAIQDVWVHQGEGGTEAQIMFEAETSADAAVEYEQSRLLDSQPIVVWKATSAYIVEVRPVETPWATTPAQISELQAVIKSSYSHFGAITATHVQPDLGYIEFPSFTSVLAFLEAEPQPVIMGNRCHTSLSTAFSKWPCMSCGFTHNLPKSKHCTQCVAMKPNFKILNLPVMWPQQLELLRLSMAMQRDENKKPHHKDHGNSREQHHHGGKGQQRSQQQFKQPLTTVGGVKHQHQNQHQQQQQQQHQPVAAQQHHRNNFQQQVISHHIPTAAAPAVTASVIQQREHPVENHVFPPTAAAVMPPVQEEEIGLGVESPMGSDQQQTLELENLFENMFFSANDSRSNTPKKDRFVFDDMAADTGVIGGSAMGLEDPWANAISFTKPESEETGLGGGLLWGLKNLGGNSSQSDDDCLIAGMGSLSLGD